MIEQPLLPGTEQAYYATQPSIPEHGMTTIKVAEQFFSLQGESATSGIPSLFLRLQHCTLHCKWCDTLEVWKSGSPWALIDLLAHWTSQGWLEKLTRGAHLVLTGGSPLMQQAQLVPLLSLLERASPFVYVELETEAVLMPNASMQRFVHQFNVSPKLANSGMSIEKRLKSDVIRFHAGHSKSFFKFVVSSEADVDELEQTYVKPFGIPNNRVWLMPEGTTSVDLKAKYGWLAEVCRDRCYNFTTRLQVLIWEKTTGV